MTTTTALMTARDRRPHAVPADGRGAARPEHPGRILERGLATVRVHDLREWGIGRHRTVDDDTYGGGAGMVLRPGAVAAALAALRRPDSIVILLDPAGEVFRQPVAHELAAASAPRLPVPALRGRGRRVRAMVDRELSIGDYVLTGGELGALVIIDAVLRLLPGAIDEASTAEESFAAGLLEYPAVHPARRVRRRGRCPPSCVSGHHEQVRRWRLRESLRRTLERRPELLEGARSRRRRRTAARRAAAAARRDAERLDGRLTPGAGRAILRRRPRRRSARRPETLHHPQPRLPPTQRQGTTP